MIVYEKPKKIVLCDCNNPIEGVFESLSERKKAKAQKGVPIHFYRYIGIETNESSYVNMLHHLNDKLLSTQSPYIYFDQGIDKAFSPEKLAYAAEIWAKFHQWLISEDKSMVDLHKLDFQHEYDTALFNWEYKNNFVKIIDLFNCNEKNSNETILKNFAICILLWSITYFKDFISQGSNAIPKILYYGSAKRNEAYFLVFASFFGCDVLYFNPEEDHEFSRIDSQDRYTRKIINTNRMPIRKLELAQKPKKIEQPTSNVTSSKSIVVAEKDKQPLSEKSYEELAGLSSSVVMIHIYQHDFFLSGYGSGVVIDNAGLIVTNYHVVKEGGSFGIVFENDKSEYLTHKLVDYNVEKDLALLRIDIKTTPFPMKRDNSLRRGQQIVAIGSPLGLMNTISDGIIAGFRSFNNLEYIQITAPISPGSSGGALIDKYGYLIGITTAGFVDGQNLNLAVSINEVLKFSDVNNALR